MRSVQMRIKDRAEEAAEEPFHRIHLCYRPGRCCGR